MWSHKLFISALQILNACINFIYHLEKQEAKTKLQTITDLHLCLSQSQEKTIDFILLILSFYASIFEDEYGKIKTMHFHLENDLA